LPSRATASQPFEVSIGLTPRPKATKTEVSFPLMIVNDTDLFNGAPMTGWRVLVGIDGQAAPDPNNGVDGCCWPSLDALKALIGAVK
jgi:hypothetical protein